MRCTMWGVYKGLLCTSMLASQVSAKLSELWALRGYGSSCMFRIDGCRFGAGVLRPGLRFGRKPTLEGGSSFVPQAVRSDLRDYQNRAPKQALVSGPAGGCFDREVEPANLPSAAIPNR